MNEVLQLELVVLTLAVLYLGYLAYSMGLFSKGDK